VTWGKSLELSGTCWIPAPLLPTHFSPTLAPCPPPSPFIPGTSTTFEVQLGMLSFAQTFFKNAIESNPSTGEKKKAIGKFLQYCS
jgi:hypothetical protein